MPSRSNIHMRSFSNRTAPRPSLHRAELSRIGDVPDLSTLLHHLYDGRARLPLVITAVLLIRAKTPSSSPASTAAMTVSIVGMGLFFLPTAIAALPRSNSMGFAP